jgi:hypothetical protein
LGSLGCLPASKQLRRSWRQIYEGHGGLWRCAQWRRVEAT